MEKKEKNNKKGGEVLLRQKKKDSWREREKKEKNRLRNKLCKVGMESNQRNRTNILDK
jgi:hypothetical protein